MVGWIAQEPGMRVLRDADPLPPDMSYALSPIVVMLLIIIVVCALRYRRRRKNNRAGWFTTFAFGAAVGNALLELNAVFLPDRPAIVRVVSPDAARTESGDPPLVPAAPPLNPDGS